MENYNLTKSLVEKLIKNQLKITFAESITGGLLASEIISIPNASKVIEESFIVYSDEAKQKILGCKKSTIKKYSVYSFGVVREMLTGLKRLSKADILVSVSGIAGPNNETNKNIGEVYFAIFFKGRTYETKLNLFGSRSEIRIACVNEIFIEIIKLIE